MKKSANFSLGKIKIQSFTTQLDQKEQETIQGAGSYITFFVRCCNANPTLQGDSCNANECRTFPETPCPPPPDSTHIKCPESGVAGCPMLNINLGGPQIEGQ